MSWGYTQANGPSTWAASFPGAGGSAQSPVDIQTNAVKHDGGLASMAVNYKAEAQYTATNTGTGFKVDLQNVSELSGGPLNASYKLVQFHWHWGPSDSTGSEHTIDGKQYAAELHLVHSNSKYSSFSEASSQPDGLAVIAVMIEAGSANEAFQDMVAVSKNVNGCGDTCKVKKSFNPSVLLPSRANEFYTYHGSLTTPPCNESVQWIVLRQSVQYSSGQLGALRSLASCEAGGCITTNHRPVMPLGGRAVSASFK
uniref:Carbonic anhydrase n=1 Tax=Archivesica packardana TaxID=1299447 RepID=A0A5P8D0T7_9BIVA|nr:carbonic anhydrase [Archivesica packardana]